MKDMDCSVEREGWGTCGRFYSGRRKKKDDVRKVSGRTSRYVILFFVLHNSSMHNMLILSCVGFDFSGAEFNGNVPDATKFMGGIKHF